MKDYLIAYTYQDKTFPNKKNRPYRLVRANSPEEAIEKVRKIYRECNTELEAIINMTIE